ncbi:MAG TPA: hypothetical protein VJM12_01040 [Pyrinomonadaceae bacterium]|nr:hypothetical protein [Pyrinomonadaceae bacterium]
MHRILTSHSCSSVQIQGWSGIRNSDLLKKAAANFDLFITADQNIRYQQNLANHPIAILELSTNDLRRIEAASAILETAVAEVQPKELKRINIP